MRRYLATVEDVKTGKALVIDARRAPAYSEGHIPGAVWVDIFDHHWADSTPRGVKLFVWQMREVMRRAGVSNSKRVIVYEEDSGMLAARVVWILDWLGHMDVALLDGGMKAWVAAGGEVTKAAVEVERTAWEPKPDSSKVATMDGIKKALGKVKVVDTRSPEEHAGTLVRAARWGTIPGAIPIHYVENLRGGKFKPASELKAMYEKAGVRPANEVVALCNGGYRSAHSYIAMRLAGFEKVRNYYAAWQEWGNLPDTPIQVPHR